MPSNEQKVNNSVEYLKNLIELNRCLQHSLLNEILLINSQIHSLSVNLENKSFKEYSGRMVPYFKDDTGASPKLINCLENTGYNKNVARNLSTKWSTADIKKLQQGVEKYKLLRDFGKMPHSCMKEIKVNDTQKHIDFLKVEPFILDATCTQTMYSNSTKELHVVKHSSNDTSQHDSQFKLNRNKSHSTSNLNSKIDFNFVAKKFVKTHSAIQCELYWKNFANLSSKELRWTIEDNKKLLEVSKKYNYRNWAKIAFELNDRNPLHTFTHFRQTYDIHNDTQRLSHIKHNNLSFYRKFTKDEDIKILDLVEKHGNECWFQISHHFKDRIPRRLRSRYLTLLTNDSVYKIWDEEKDVELLRLRACFGDEWETISEHLSDISAEVCRKRYNFLKKHRKNNIWLVGLIKEESKNYSDIDSINQNNDNKKIQPKNSSESESELVQMSEFKKLFKLQVMSLKKKLKILKSKSKCDENWKKVYKYMTFCIWKLENCLKPDSAASDYKIRFEILKTFSSIPRKTIHDIYQLIIDSDLNKIWFDLHHGFLYSKNDYESLKFDKSINVKDTVYKIFGHLLFDTKIQLDQSTNISPQMITNAPASLSKSDQDEINSTLAKNEVLLQKSDISHYRKRKKRQCKK